MTRSVLIAIAAAGSAALFLGALAFQYIGGLPPCAMCYWQRYPHIAAVVIGIAALTLPGRALPLLGALAATVTAGIGIFHAGVEKGYWEGPSTCTSGSVGGLTPEQLMEQIMSAPLVRCDDVVWSMLDISMAGWNAVLSLGLMLIWIAAAMRKA